MVHLRLMGFFAAVVVVLAGGCGGDAVDPDVTGIVNAVVHDDPLEGSAKRSALFTGTAAGNMQVSLRSTGGVWTDVGSPNGITVNLQSSTETAVHGATSVPAGTFDRVRLTFSDVEVTVKAGGVIGGITLQSDAKAALAEDFPVTVERSVSPFFVDEVGTALIEFDLNVENWLDLQTLDEGTIDGAAVNASVDAEATFMPPGS